MLQYRSHSEKLEQIKNNNLSLIENTQYFINNIEKNQDLNAFNFVFEDAVESSKIIEEKIKSGTHGKLAGMVVAVKDVLAINDRPLTCSSKILKNLLQLMNEAGYIGTFEEVDDLRGGELKVNLLGKINACGVIKPRFSVRKTELENFESRYLPAQDFGVLILTTTEGVITHTQARSLGVGGRLLAFVY